MELYQENSSNHFVIIFPSGSDMTGIPLTTTDSYGGSTSHEYVLEVGTDGTTIDGSNTLESSEINQFDLASTHLGFDTWFMVGAANQVAQTNFNLGFNPSSGSIDCCSIFIYKGRKRSSFSSKLQLSSTTQNSNIVLMV